MGRWILSLRFHFFCGRETGGDRFCGRKYIRNVCVWVRTYTHMPRRDFCVCHRDVSLCHREVSPCHREMSLCHREISLCHKEISLWHREVSLCHREVSLWHKDISLWRREIPSTHDFTHTFHAWLHAYLPRKGFTQGHARPSTQGLARLIFSIKHCTSTYRY